MAPESEVQDLNRRRRHFIELDSFAREIKFFGTQTFEITRKSKDSTLYSGHATCLKCRRHI